MGENQNSRIAPGGDTKDGPPSPSAFTAYIYLDALFSVPPPGGTIEIATQIASYIAWNIVILIAHGKLDMIS